MPLERKLTPAVTADLALRLAPLLMILAIAVRPDELSDLGWQLRLGERIAQSGTPFLGETWAADHLGEHLVPNAWLAQLIFAKARMLGGWHLLRGFDAAIWLGSLLVAAAPAQRRGERPLAILLALAIGFAVALPAISIRPQSFAALGFALTFGPMQAIKSWRKAALIGAPLFVLWQNLHPSVALAAAILGLVAASLWVRNLIGKGDRPWPATALAGLAAAAVFATPAGSGIVAFAWQNELASKAAGATEWFPVWEPVNRIFLLPVAASAAMAAAILFRDRRSEILTDALVWAATLSLAVIATRFILFYALALIPIVARCPIGSTLPAQYRMATGAAVSAAALLGSLAVLFILPVRISEIVSNRAIAQIQASAGNGTIYCDPAYGGAIIDAAPDRARVSMDGRFFLYTREEIGLFNATETTTSSLATIVARSHPSAFLLFAARSPALIQELRRSPDNWQELEDDRGAILFVKRAARQSP